MVEYFCGKCGKTFYQKSHAEAHKKRKTPCDKPKSKTHHTSVDVLLHERNKQSPPVTESPS